MKTFVFLLIVLNSGGNDSTFVIDYNLTYEDCDALYEQWHPTLDEHSFVLCEEE